MGSIAKQIILMDILSDLESAATMLSALLIIAFLVASAIRIVTQMEKDFEACETARKAQRKMLIPLIASFLISISIPDKRTMYAAFAMKKVSEIEGINKLPENAVKYLNNFFEELNKKKNENESEE